MHFIFLIIVFALAQVLILNHIHLFDMVTPLLYVYLVVLFPRNTSHVARLLLSFGMGIIIDTFNNTQGLAAASLTLAGFVQPYYLELYLRKEDEQNFSPSVASLGFFKYLAYAALVVFTFSVAFYALELFSVTYWMESLIGCAGSSILTLTLILTIDSLRK